MLLLLLNHTHLIPALILWTQTRVCCVSLRSMRTRGQSPTSCVCVGLCWHLSWVTWSSSSIFTSVWLCSCWLEPLTWWGPRCYWSQSRAKKTFWVDFWHIDFSLIQLDGYIARTWPTQKSALGSALDPLADKILISILYLSLTYAELIPGTGLWTYCTLSQCCRVVVFFVVLFFILISVLF